MDGGSDQTEVNHESQKETRSFKIRGQTTIVSKFPDIVDRAAEFVKQCGFSAQCRRRPDIHLVLL